MPNYYHVYLYKGGFWLNSLNQGIYPQIDPALVEVAKQQVLMELQQGNNIKTQTNQFLVQDIKYQVLNELQQGQGMNSQANYSLIRDIKNQVLYELQQSQKMNPLSKQSLVHDVTKQVLVELNKSQGVRIRPIHDLEPTMRQQPPTTVYNPHMYFNQSLMDVVKRQVLTQLSYQQLSQPHWQPKFYPQIRSVNTQPYPRLMMGTRVPKDSLNPQPLQSHHYHLNKPYVNTCNQNTNEFSDSD
jgi:hypothetical protein